MKALVVYESMFGNTRQVAHAVSDGLSAYMDSDVRSVGAARGLDLGAVDLLVVGGPTHVWSMSRPSTRKAAADQASDPAKGVALEPGATGPGLREWLATVDLQGAAVAVFDTRMAMPAAVTGSAARPIAKMLHRRGAHFVSTRRSFLVTKQNQLVDGQLELADKWARDLAESVTRTGAFVR